MPQAKLGPGGRDGRDRRVSILVTAVLPDEAVNAFLQAIRDFHAAYPGDRLHIVAAARHHSTAEIERMFDLDPPFGDGVTLVK